MGGLWPDPETLAELSIMLTVLTSRASARRAWTPEGLECAYELIGGLVDATTARDPYDPRRPYYREMAP